MNLLLWSRIYLSRISACIEDVTPNLQAATLRFTCNIFYKCLLFKNFVMSKGFRNVNYQGAYLCFTFMFSDFFSLRLYYLCRDWPLPVGQPEVLLLFYFSIPRESGTFRHSAATMFSRLPIVTRNILDHIFFCRSAKKHLFVGYQSWILIIIVVYFNISYYVSSINFIVITFLLAAVYIYITNNVYSPVTIMRFLD